MDSLSALSDITFACAHCAAPLVVDAAAAGLRLPCQHCGKPTPVPDIPSMGARDTEKAKARVADVRQQLKENESQRTEVTGYINQLTTQMHRWQLRLQTLEERRRELEAQLESSKNDR